MINAKQSALRKAAAGKYHQSLIAGVNTPAQTAIDYLHHRYGQHAEAVVKGGGLGFVLNPAPGHEHAQGRMVIPYLTTSGSVLAFKFRCLRRHDCKEAKCPKYTNVAGLGSHLYNAHITARTKSDIIVICEGELDALVMSYVVGIPAVGVPGVKAWDKGGPSYEFILEDFSEVIIMADGDGPGKEFAQMLATHPSFAGRTRIVTMPDGHDVSSWLMHPDGGKDALEAMVYPTDEDEAYLDEYLAAA